MRLISATMLLLIVGCGYTPKPPPKTVKVEGKVLLPNGRPLHAGRIVFMPVQAGAQEANAELEKDGSFSLTSYQKDDGAVPGAYVVVVELMSYKGGGATRVNAPVPQKYLNEKTSGIKMEVTNDMPPCVVHLK